MQQQLQISAALIWIYQDSLEINWEGRSADGLSGLVLVEGVDRMLVQSNEIISTNSTALFWIQG